MNTFEFRLYITTTEEEALYLFEAIQKEMGLEAGSFFMLAKKEEEEEVIYATAD